MLYSFSSRGQYIYRKTTAGPQCLPLISLLNAVSSKGGYNSLRGQIMPTHDYMYTLTPSEE